MDEPDWSPMNHGPPDIYLLRRLAEKISPFCTEGYSASCLQVADASLAAMIDSFYRSTSALTVAQGIFLCRYDV